MTTRGLGALCLLPLLVGCGRQPFVVLTIEDPQEVAKDFATLHVGLTQESLENVTVSRTTFPLSITVTTQKAGDHELWVEARASSGAKLGLGKTMASTASVGTPTATVKLSKTCSAAAECDDGLFCTGAETCGDGMCITAVNPCAANVDCATSSCVEGTAGRGACNIEVDHARCPTGTYCNPIRGCIEGRGCVDDVDCRDTSVCNGDERCINLVCATGTLPVLDDEDVCTVDGCNDDRVNEGLLPVFHIAQASLDGFDCVVPGTGNPGTPGVCVSSKGGCRVSECWDGVVSSAEDCDDGNLNPADGCDACAATVWEAMAIVGNNSLASAVDLNSPNSVAIDRRGNIYIADTGNNRIRMIAAGTGVISTIAGIGTGGFSGDGEVAAHAQLNHPYGVAVNGLGDIYVADTWNNRIRMIVAATGEIHTIAGIGGMGSFSGDNGPATSAAFDSPESLAVDGLGNIYVGDYYNARIRRIDARTNVISTFAGGGTEMPGDGGPATSARLAGPSGVVLDNLGDLFFSDSGYFRVRKITVATGIIQTVAGNGTSGSSGDGGLATNAQVIPRAIAFNELGDMFIADGGNHRIRKVSAGIIETIAGTGVGGSSGDGDLATNARLYYPQGIAIDASGNTYFSDTGNNRLRMISETTGYIDTVAGTGASFYSGDGGAATSAQLNYPKDVAVDGLGNVYVADTNNHRVRKVTAATGVVSTVAGTGIAGYSGDAGDATAAQLNAPDGITVDGSGNVYIADTENNCVRKVAAATGVISTVAGTGVAGYSGDTGLATSAQLNAPSGVALDGDGNLYVADTTNQCIRKVTAMTGTIDTVAGTGVSGYSGDEGPATEARLCNPSDMTFDSAGNMFIADTSNDCIRKVRATDGAIETVVGTGTEGFSGDGDLATGAQIFAPCGVAVDSAGNLLVSDSWNQRIREVTAATGKIATIAGTGAQGFLGDGGDAAGALFSYARGITFDNQGNLYAAVSYPGTVRKIAPTGSITTIAGQVDPEGMGPLGQARLADPRAIVWANASWLFAGGSSGTVQRLRTPETWLSVVSGRYRNLGGPTANLARFRANTFGLVGGIAFDAVGNRIYLTESSANRLHVVTMVNPDDETTWTIADLAGDAAGGTEGFVDDTSSEARFRGPTGLFLDETPGILYIADTGNHVIRALDLGTSAVVTVIGTPETLGSFGDNGLASQALLYQPEALTRCSNGDFFVADTGNNRVRRVHRVGPDSIITTVLGDGTGASSGEGYPASTFPVEAPRGLACDAFGNLFVVSTETVRLLPATDDGIVDGTGPVQTIYGGPPRNTFPASISSCLTGLAVVEPNRVRVTDSCAGLLVELTRQPKP